MKGLFKTLYFLVSVFFISVSAAFATDNQTDDLSPILSQNSLPFSIDIQQANFQLPQGVHSGIIALYQGLWVIMAGRTNGLHGFGPDPFPPAAQNTTVYVINPETGYVASRSLLDASSGLTQQQVDTLSVTSPEGYQEDNTFYMVGGYGVDTRTSTFSTKPVLTAINIPGIIKWVTEPANKNHSVIKNIKQLYNPIFEVTGGRLFKIGNVMQLVFGQRFTGVYTPGSTGDYTQLVRRFTIKNNQQQLLVDILPSQPLNQDSNFNRRDLNVVPAILPTTNNLMQYGLIAYSGVFTPAGGIWTVPVIINGIDNPFMPNPVLPSTFKQGMNHYISAIAGIYSRKYSSMYNIFFGGMSYGYYDGGVFQTDAEIPFINQVTTVRMDKNGNFTQYFMNNQYPEIISTTVNPGNVLLFGAAAVFIPKNILSYPNKVINFDNIRTPTVIGHIVGGIMSTVPNTSSDADSAASPYIFTVTLIPKTPSV